MSALYTFKDLQDQVLSNLDESGDTGTTLTLVKSFLNQAQQMRLSQENWPFLRWDIPETFTVSSTTRRYALHPEFWRPIYFFNQGTRSFMHIVPERQISSSGALWNTDLARANLFRHAGTTAVAAQPSSASVLALSSSSSGDAGATYNVIVTGIVSGGLRSETITPTGTTPASGALAFTKVLRVTLTTAFTGTLTLTANGAAVTLLTLSPGEKGRAYPQIELLATPTATETVEYSFLRQPLKMVEDNDLPDLPPPHSQILVWDALLLFAGYNTDISPASLVVWKEMRDTMSRALFADYIEGNEVDGQPRTIRNVEDDGWTVVPRVFFS